MNDAVEFANTTVPSYWDNRSTIFVMGCPRSGTTLVSQLLSTHSKISLYHESFLYHIFASELKYYGRINNKNNLRRLCTDVCETLSKQGRELTDGSLFIPSPTEVYDGIRESSFNGIVDSVFRNYATQQGKRRGGDKTPGNFDYLSQIIKNHPASPILYLMRDPRDTILSNRRLFGTSIDQGVTLWGRAFQSLQDCRDGVLTIRYETLVDDPNTTVPRIFAAINEDFQAQTMDFFKSIPRSFRSKGDKIGLLDQAISSSSIGNYESMPVEDIQNIERACAAGMDAYGYERLYFREPATAFKIRQESRRTKSIAWYVERLSYYGFNPDRWRHGWIRWRLMARVRIRYFFGRNT